MFAKTIMKQGQKITRQEKKIERLKEENRKLKSFKEKFERIIENANENKENYCITFEKINNELDNLHID